MCFELVFVGCLGFISVACGCVVGCAFVLIHLRNVCLVFTLDCIGLFMVFRLLVLDLVCFAICWFCFWIVVWCL